MGQYTGADKNTGDQFTAAEHNLLKTAVNDNDTRLVTAETKLTGIENGATADQDAAEIETLYNSQVGQVSAPEIADGTETAIRRYSPADIVAIIAAHESAGGSTPLVDETTVLKFASDFTKHITQASPTTDPDLPVTGNISVTLDGSAAIGSRAFMLYNGSTAPNLSGANFVQEQSLTENFLPDQDIWFEFILTKTGANARILFRMAEKPLDDTYQSNHFDNLSEFALPAAVAEQPALADNDSNGLARKRLLFTTGGTEEWAGLEFTLPDNYVPGGLVKAKLHWEAPASTSGAITWGLSAVALADGVGGYPSHGAETLVSDNVQGGGESLMRTLPSDTLTIPGTPGPGKRLNIKVALKTTSAVNAYLLGLTIQYQVDSDVKVSYVIPSNTTEPSKPVLAMVLENETSVDFNISTPSTHPVYPVTYRWLVNGVVTGSPFSGTSPTLSGLTASTAYNVQVQPIATTPDGTTFTGEPSDVVAVNTTAGSFSPPLDGLGALAGWSLNMQLTTAQTELFTLRNDSGGATHVIGFDAGTGHVDSAAVSTILGGLPGTAGPIGATLVSVVDASGNHDTMDWDVYNEPPLHYDPVLDIFYLVTDGATQYVGRAGHSPRIDIPQPAIWISGINFLTTPAGTTRARAAFASSNEHHLSMYATGFPGIHAGGTVLYATSNVVGANAVFTARYDGASSYLRVNGTQEASGDTGSEAHEGHFSGANSNGNGQYPEMRWFFEICLPGTTSNTNRDNVETSQRTLIGA